MPASINDYDQSDEDSGGLSEGFTPAQSNAVGSAQGPQQAKPQKQQDDSFTPWSSFVSANQDVSQREAGKLEGQVQGDVSKAQSDLSGAQSTFNNSVDSNYNQPTQSQAKAPAGASPDQTHPQANDTSGSWSDLATPPAPAPASPAPKTPRVNPQTVTSATQPAPTQVTSQNPANAVIPTKLTRPQSGPVGTPTALPQQAQTGAQSQQRQSIGGYGYQALTPGANANGPHDLEQAAGQQGWAQLGLDTTKAQQAANALGSETGVQGLLQQQQYSPQQNTAFDAALINGQGGPQFAKLAQEYGGNQLEQNAINAEQASQNRWNQFMGDEATKQGFANAETPAAPTSRAMPSPLGGLRGSTGSTSKSFVTSTDGANGQFDPSQFPPNFDPSSSPQYQDAIKALQAAAPLPPYADTFADLNASPNYLSTMNTWAKDLGMTPGQLATQLSTMPQWQWELFARGIIPSNFGRGSAILGSTPGLVSPTVSPSGTGQSYGYFEGFAPANVQATGAGSSSSDFANAMSAYEAAIMAVAGGGSGAAFGAAQNAITNNAKNPSNTGDPFGNRG